VVELFNSNEGKTLQLPKESAGWTIGFCSLINVALALCLMGMALGVDVEYLTPPKIKAIYKIYCYSIAIWLS